MARQEPPSDGRVLRPRIAISVRPQIAPLTPALNRRALYWPSDIKYVMVQPPEIHPCSFLPFLRAHFARLDSLATPSAGKCGALSPLARTASDGVNRAAASSKGHGCARGGVSQRAARKGRRVEESMAGNTVSEPAPDRGRGEARSHVARPEQIEGKATCARVLPHGCASMPSRNGASSTSRIGPAPLRAGAFFGRTA